MSKIKVNRLENTSTANGGIDIDSSGHVQIEGQQMPTAGPLSNRNLIINGSMTATQRGTVVSSITSTGNYRTVDRFKQYISSLGTWTLEQHASGPTGFKNSYRVTCTSGNASPAAGSYVFIRYGVEKQDMEQLAWGTTGAKEFTLSFWVKSNRTGTASLTILYSDGNLRGMTKTYTINTANTWEYKTLTFPANGLSESSDGDNGTGFWIEWWLNSGSSFTSGSVNTDWATLNDSQRNPTNFGLGSVNDQEFHLTGVQLEVGSKATSFEHVSYSQTFQKCLRYFFKPDCEGSAKQTMMGTSYGTNSYYIPVQLPVPMRVAPAVPTNAGSTWRSRSSNVNAISGGTWGMHGGGSTTSVVIHQSGGSIAANTPFWFETNSTSGCSLEFDAEM